MLRLNLLKVPSTRNNILYNKSFSTHHSSGSYTQPEHEQFIVLPVFIINTGDVPNEH